MNPASSGLTMSPRPAYPTVVGPTHTAHGLGQGTAQAVMSAQTDEIFNGPFFGGEVCIADEAVRCPDSPESGQRAFVPWCGKRPCSVSNRVSRRLRRGAQVQSKHGVPNRVSHCLQTARPRSFRQLHSGVVRCTEGGCKKVFPDLVAWSRHRHEQAEKLYPCTKANCNKSYTRLSNLANHLRVHSGERPFKCRYPGCQSAFTRSSYLNTHEKTHQPEKTFQCAYCWGFYTSKRSLVRHINTRHSA